MNVPYCSGVETAAVKKLHPSRYEVAKPCVYHDVTNVPVNQPPTAKYAVGNNNKPDQPTKNLSFFNQSSTRSKCHVLGFAQ
jgi:hypothetical protein